MPNKPTPISPEELWQSQPEEEMNMTLATIRSKALKFQRKISNRNLREYVAAVIVTAAYGAYIVYLPNLLQKIGSALVIAGVFVVVYWLHRHGSSKDVPVDSSARDCLDFHRQELTRQRDLLRQVGSRYIGPLVPGGVIFFAGTWMEAVDDGRGAIVMTITALLGATVLGGVNWLNVRAANKLQRDIDSLGE
ncbi:MAG: hypothetical protein O3A53_07275 [Acidobacteria bacterium]|nr:hypothetical protein [Acidobacteriota bacterium]MDA1234586.1 hypothetical protein [Acidobacteriota bacterium]